MSRTAHRPSFGRRQLASDPDDRASDTDRPLNGRTGPSRPYRHQRHRPSPSVRSPAAGPLRPLPHPPSPPTAGPGPDAWAPSPPPMDWPGPLPIPPASTVTGAPSSADPGSGPGCGYLLAPRSGRRYAVWRPAPPAHHNAAFQQHRIVGNGRFTFPSAAARPPPAPSGGASGSANSAAVAAKVTPGLVDINVNLSYQGESAAERARSSPRRASSSPIITSSTAPPVSRPSISVMERRTRPPSSVTTAPATRRHPAPRRPRV